MKESEKIDKYADLNNEQKSKNKAKQNKIKQSKTKTATKTTTKNKPVEYEGNSDTNCSRRTWNDPQQLEPPPQG